MVYSHSMTMGMFRAISLKLHQQGEKKNTQKKHIPAHRMRDKKKKKKKKREKKMMMMVMMTQKLCLTFDEMYIQCRSSRRVYCEPLNKSQSLLQKCDKCK